jgi:hypothetical protein
VHYRKIIDVTWANSKAIGQEELMSFEARLREFALHRPRGPLAIVADPNRGDLARTFKALTSADRPIEVFRSIHEARKWLAAQPFGG